MSENAIEQPNRPDVERGDPGDEQLDLDDRFHVLQNERRRRVIRYLSESDAETFEMSDIAEEVGARENDTSREALTSQQRQRVYIALYQCHLPKLAEVGLIDYRQRRGVVETRPELYRVVEHLPDGDPVRDGEERAEPDSPGPSLAGSGVGTHLGVATVALTFTLGAWLDVLPAEFGLTAVVAISGIVAAAAWVADG